MLGALLLLLLACGRHGGAPAAAAVGPQGVWTADPDAARWMLRAVVAEEEGDLAEARRALQWVARLDRRSPWPLVAMGRLEERAGEYTAAARAYEEALRRGEVAEAWLGLGRARRCLGDPSFEETLQRAAELGLGTEVAAVARRGCGGS